MTVTIMERIGNSAELLVCYDLTQKGFRAALSPFSKSPYDVICEQKQGLLRVQVKGTLQAKSTNGKRSVNGAKSYTFHHNSVARDQSDLIALVALDSKTILYIPTAELDLSKKSFCFPSHVFSKTHDEALYKLMAK